MDHLHSIFWEDLDNAQTRIQQAMTALQSLQNAIQTGQIDQPTRQDSKRLNRLMVLAELLYAEIRPWNDALPPAAQPGSNGTH